MARRSSGPTATELHRAWLELVDTDGPFIAIPALKEVWPQGIPPLPDDARAALAEAKPAFDKAWDAWDRWPDDEASRATYAAARDAWVEVVLRDVFSWGDLWCVAAAAPEAVTAARVRSAEGIVVEPTGVMQHEYTVAALAWVIDPVDSLRDLVGDGWASSPIDRMDAMLRHSGIRVGVVTDGRWWAVVSAAPGTMTASGIVDALTWVEEPATRNAFAALLAPIRLIGGHKEHRLPALFADSVLAAEQVTEALGVQVRKAVELVVAAFAESADDARRRGEPSPLPDDGETIYDAVVTVLMRVVFLLFAQERGLLPQGDLFERAYGLIGQLDVLDVRAREEDEDSLDATHLTWHRLLATSRALYDGASFEDLRLPAYGGSLFDAARFPFLDARTDRGTLALTVSDRVMWQVLHAVQVAKPKGQDARRISFRDIDVEQIGYIYEGLLGYTCRSADEVIVGLLGTDGQEPEIPLAELERLAEQHFSDADIAKAVLAWAKEDQPASKPPSASALTNALAGGDTVEDAERAVRVVAPDDAALRERLLPWIGAIRRDLRGRPVVIPPGGLIVVETPSRRNAGAHYTPRSLAEEVVEHALAPLVYAPGPHQTADHTQWQLISSDDILDLRVADIACGSGAFLVAAARYLAARLVEAWHHEGPATMSPSELETAARRKVVAQCLYGADINAMAVEMCKLSLWLVSLDRDLPFSFVDDKVLHGNSLLGVTDLRQIEAMHIDPHAVEAEGLFEVNKARQLAERLDVDHVVERVRRKRRQLASEIDDRDPQRTANAKRRQLAEINRDLAQLWNLADGVIAAGLRAGGNPGKALNEAYDDLRVAAGRAYPKSGEGDPAMLDSLIATGLTPTAPTDYERWQPLHWALAVPDVIERGGFDAIIGNPPFLGGKKITSAVGSNLREWLVNVLAEGTKGNADLVAYFFLRATTLLTSRGNLGLIATNTVAQGDSREVGLERMVENGFTITRSIQSRAWPAASANLEYAAVWGTRNSVIDDVLRVCDDVAVRQISPLLEPEGRVEGSPRRLTENAGIAFQGCIVLGKGFVISALEAKEWIGQDHRNAEVILPYLNGQDLNSRPDCTASRWVIDLGERSELEASTYGAPWERLLSKVRPERITKDADKYPRMVHEWWKFWNARPAMRKAIADLDEVLVIAQTSSTQASVRVANDQTFDQKIIVFASDDFDLLATLNSSMHRLWATARGSTRTGDPVYTPSDVFVTFPRPPHTADQNRAGRTLDRCRREIMLRRDLGLTKLYNLVNDPDIADHSDADVARLRAIHVELDGAVMAAYGWDDVPLDHGFHTYRQMTRWTVSPAARVEILDRLLEENHRRAALEQEAGDDE